MSHQFGLLDRVSAFVVVLDSDGHVVWCNHAAERHFGYTSEEVRGRRIHDVLVFADQGDDVDRALQFSRTQGESVSLELACTTRAKERRWLAWTVAPLGDGSDELIVTGVDITPRKRSEELARFLADAGHMLAGTLDYRETLSSVAHLAVQSYADLCIIDLVDDAGAVQRIQSVARDPVVQPVAAALMAYPSQAQRPYLGAAAIRSGESTLVAHVTPEMLQQLAQDGVHLSLLRQMKPVSFMAIPLKVRDRVIGSLIFTSTRPGRSYDQQDVRAAEQLAIRAALAIDNARLYQDAQRASQARDEVLGVVAHDLRSPLNSISLSASVLQRRAARKEEPELRELAEGISQAVSQMNRLVQDLLDKTRLDAGRLSVEACACAPETLVAQGVEAVRPLLSNLKLEVEVAPGLPAVHADAARVRQVFTNLIGNAIKFTPAGGRIRVGAKLRGEVVEFWVADNGPGIPAEQLPHVFDRFWQGRRTDTSGAGLGLAIVKGIVESHGGHVSAESAVGQGTTFRFTLPCVATATAAAPASG